MAMLVSVADMRLVSGFDATPTVNAAYEAASKSAAADIGSRIGSDFKKETGVQDSFMPRAPLKFGPGLNQRGHKLRLSHGFVSGVQVEVSDSPNGTFSAIDANVSVDAVKGIVTIYGNSYEGRCLMVTYTKGFDATNDLYQNVPEDLVLYARVRAFEILDALNPSLRLGDDKKASIAAKPSLTKYLRYAPDAEMPL